jgi:hypothetical protein
MIKIILVIIVIILLISISPEKFVNMLNRRGR